MCPIPIIRRRKISERVKKASNSKESAKLFWGKIVFCGFPAYPVYPAYRQAGGRQAGERSGRQAKNNFFRKSGLS